MGLETRFARAASGPIPYRVDGSGARHLLIVSDWAQPYGEPGVAAFDGFAQALAGNDATVVTLLDGAMEGTLGTQPDIDLRLAGARAAAEASGMGQATLLGSAGGAPVAALLAAQEPDRFARLILYDTFPPETRNAWPIRITAGAPESIPDLEKLESELKTAGAA